MTITGASTGVGRAVARRFAHDGAKIGLIARGRDGLDATALRRPLVDFLPAHDSQIVGTVAAIERDLICDGRVRRYATDETEDGVCGDEGASDRQFLLADVHALQRREAEACKLFERLCDLANDAGLLAEEHDGTVMLGNFPQGLSHLSLVSAAMNLGNRGGPAQERGGSS
ncbi:glycoside hydrolase family 15 protein [Novosphingobium fluoreni]|uniref:glycoside hydrolase family 15 protein n=1 Tax=Novosphingobium fluoreni TaxID=1391222 RepID=UPI003DA0C02A